MWWFMSEWRCALPKLKVLPCIRYMKLRRNAYIAVPNASIAEVFASGEYERDVAVQGILNLLGVARSRHCRAHRAVAAPRHAMELSHLGQGLACSWLLALNVTPYCNVLQEQGHLQPIYHWPANDVFQLITNPENGALRPSPAVSLDTYHCKHRPTSFATSKNLSGCRPSTSAPAIPILRAGSGRQTSTATRSQASWGILPCCRISRWHKTSR